MKAKDEQPFYISVFKLQRQSICVPILPNQTHVKIFKNDIFAFYVSIHPYETEKKVW